MLSFLKALLSVELKHCGEGKFHYINMWHEARKHEKKLRVMIVDYRKRAERRREFYEKFKADPAQFMQVHGRPCKIHVDPQVTSAAEKCLMPWQGQKDVLIDRFDGRAFLDIIPDPPQKAAGNPEPGPEEPGLNYERYRILIQNDVAGISEDKFLHQIHIEEQFGTSAPHSHKGEKSSKAAPPKAAIGYTYEGSTSTTSAAFKAQDKGDDSEDDIDFDLIVNVNDLTIAQTSELNQNATSYGMPAGSFMNFLNNDIEEREQTRMAKLQEEEKQAMSGRKARRERRAYKDKIILRKGHISPPSYAAPDSPVPGPEIDEGAHTSSNSDSETGGQASPEKITFITSFGGNESDKEKDENAKRFVENRKASTTNSTKRRFNFRLTSPVKPKPRSRSRSPKRKKYSYESRSRSGSIRRRYESHTHRRDDRSRTRSPKRRPDYKTGSTRHRRSYSDSSSSNSESGKHKSSHKSKSRSYRGRRSYSRSRSPSEHRSSRRWRNRSRRKSKSRSSSSSRSGRRSDSHKRLSRSPVYSYAKVQSPPASTLRSSPPPSAAAGRQRNPSSNNNSVAENQNTESGKLPSPPVKRYYGRGGVRDDEDSPISLSSSDSDDGKRVKNSRSQDRSNNHSRAPGGFSVKTGASSASKEHNNTKGLTPQERLKRKMQAALNKQLKTDKDAERTRFERLEQERIEREESLRELTIKYRRRERERRHRNRNTSGSSSEASGSDNSKSRSSDISPLVDS